MSTETEPKKSSDYEAELNLLKANNGNRWNILQVSALVKEAVETDNLDALDAAVSTIKEPALVMVFEISRKQHKNARLLKTARRNT